MSTEYSPEKNEKKTKVMFYHISGMSFGGTEKFLQVIAKYLNKEKYEVYFMYSTKPRESTGNIKLDGRLEYMQNSGVHLIPFEYKKLKNKYPYEVEGMHPTIFEKITENNIDLLFVTGAGYAEFPFNVIRHIPILFINIFGVPNVQSNVARHICISKAVKNKITPVVSDKKIDVIYIQSELPNASYKEFGKALRDSLGIRDTDTVFGRIGRADDAIFDPIGIQAFKGLVQSHPTAHYIIMSPPPVLREIVKNENIPNVHFIAPSGDEKDVWAFHYSLDALAHFRYDGESFGLNIAESMIAGNPIITHKSHIWNAHLEYLDASFSYIAEKDDVLTYRQHMESIVRVKENGEITKMKEAAAQAGKKLFIINNSIDKIESMIDNAVL